MDVLNLAGSTLLILGGIALFGLLVRAGLNQLTFPYARNILWGLSLVGLIGGLLLLNYLKLPLRNIMSTLGIGLMIEGFLAFLALLIRAISSQPTMRWANFTLGMLILVGIGGGALLYFASASLH